jgi:hypothetical protein
MKRTKNDRPSRNRHPAEEELKRMSGSSGEVAPVDNGGGSGSTGPIKP